jgi:hypothetical protein
MNFLKKVMHWGKFKYFFKKIHSKIHLHVKIIFGKRDYKSYHMHKKLQEYELSQEHNKGIKSQKMQA